MTTDSPSSEPRNSQGRSWALAIARAVGASVVGILVTFYGGCVLALGAYTVVDPWTTGVQIQRRLTAEDAYEKRYAPRPLSALDDDLPAAVVAAEDTRFFEHNGIDWAAIGEAIEENRDGDAQRRGGSTITQQLVKNLFLTTHSTYFRKALELPLTYLAELILSKRRILELYLNVIEWGPGVYGAEAAAQYYYGTSAAQLTRYQAAALAACIPNPLVRHPMHMDWYTRIILRRMKQLGPIQPHLETSTRKDPSPPIADRRRPSIGLPHRSDTPTTGSVPPRPMRLPSPTSDPAVPAHAH